MFSAGCAAVQYMFGDEKPLTEHRRTSAVSSEQEPTAPTSKRNHDPAGDFSGKDVSSDRCRIRTL
jgi:hypothetical protein